MHNNGINKRASEPKPLSSRSQSASVDECTTSRRTVGEMAKNFHRQPDEWSPAVAGRQSVARLGWAEETLDANLRALNCDVPVRGRRGAAARRSNHEPALAPPGATWPRS